MRKIYDEKGKEIPAEDIALLAFEAIKTIRKTNEERLYQQISDLVNKKIKEKAAFTRDDVISVVDAVKNHDRDYPFNI